MAAPFIPGGAVLSEPASGEHTPTGKPGNGDGEEEDAPAPN
jgi:hypothetical protein